MSSHTLIVSDETWQAILEDAAAQMYQKKQKPQVAEKMATQKKKVLRPGHGILITCVQAGKILGLSRSSVTHLANTDELNDVSINRTKRFHRDDVLIFQRDKQRVKCDACGGTFTRQGLGPHQTVHKKHKLSRQAKGW